MRQVWHAHDTQLGRAVALKWMPALASVCPFVTAEGVMRVLYLAVVVALTSAGCGGDGTNTASNVPVAVSGGLAFRSVSAANHHSCGVTTAGVAYCWGDNRCGALGDGTHTDSNVPVAGSGRLTFQSVSTSRHHSCGVTTAGVAYCWGA